MAVFCLARSLRELEERLGRMVVAETRMRRDANGKPIGRRAITAADLGAAGAMTALLKDAFRPNLVQTLEHTPAIVHGGPFANIAHGCNSLVATETALGLADWVVTEAGFGADLGAEKFVDIKCRLGNLKPDVSVLVATLRALKMHGGVAKSDLAGEDVEALRRGATNLKRHIANLKRLGLPVLVALNEFAGDSPAELDALRAVCAAEGAELHICRHWAEGGAGAIELAHAVVRTAEAGTARLHYLYPDEMDLAGKIDAIATKFYGAAGIDLDPAAAKRVRELEMAGYGHLPVCIAKTQYSFSGDPTALGAPSGHRLAVREIRLSAGAGFVVALCGDIRTMPGLPRKPAAEGIGVDREGEIFGLS
jgi:formate--tetrahydrofolate ligase